MRLLAVLVAICALSQTALAQTSECKSITDAGTRLACYDRTTSPAASSAAAAKPASRAAKPASRTAPASKVETGKTAPASKVDGGKYVDSISAEDALMNARLRNICRGC